MTYPKSKTALLSALRTFWIRQPALLYGGAVLIGISVFFDKKFISIIPALILFIPLISPETWKKALCTLIIGLSAFCYCSVKYQFPSFTEPHEKLQGIAHISIDCVSNHSTHFGKQWIYKGTILSMQTQEGKKIASNIPFVLPIPKGKDLERPVADKEYKVFTSLREMYPYHYSLAVSKNTPWHPIQKSWSLAEWRFNAKGWIREYIQQRFSHERTAVFLSGLATGEFDDRLLQLEFGRFGLLHLMAISGFHFTLIAMLIGFMLRMICPLHWSISITLFLLSSYFVFLGTGPSVLRAWISIIVVFLGYFLQRRSLGLNTLGVALIGVLLYDPMQWKQMGFQFSFVTTGAILLCYHSCDGALQGIFQKRTLSNAIEMNGWNQHAYCFLAIFREGLALALAVNIVALPMTLYFFHKFPLMSLVYNLFFPFLVSIAMLLLIVGILWEAILPFGVGWIHQLNDFYTYKILLFTHNLPINYDRYLRIESMSSEFIIMYLCAVFIFFVYLKERKKQQSLVLV